MKKRKLKLTLIVVATLVLSFTVGPIVQASDDTVTTTSGKVNIED